jgi:hypothetical protein
MAFNIIGNVGAGTGADMLQEILRRKATEYAQSENRRIAEETRKHAAAQDAARLEEQRRQHNESLGLQKARDLGVVEDRKALAANRLRDDQLNELKIMRGGHVLDPNDPIVKAFPRMFDPDVQSPAPPSADFVGPMQPVPTGKVKFVGTVDEANREAQRRLQEELRQAQDAAALARVQATIAGKPPQRDRYQLMPDGKGGVVRVDMDTGIGMPVTMQGGATVATKPPAKTVEQIRAEAQARAAGTAAGTAAAKPPGLITGLLRDAFGSTPSAAAGAPAPAVSHAPTAATGQSPADIAAAKAFLQANGAPVTEANIQAVIARQKK